MPKVSQISRILERSIQWAVNGYDFLNRFGREMNVNQLTELIATGNRILSRIDELPEHRRSNRYVIDCRKAMEYVVDLGEEMIVKEK